MSRRTIFRDLDVLRQAGVPMLFDDDRGEYRIPGTYYLPPTNFTAEEALAVMVLCYELGESKRLPFCGPAQRAAIKLESSLPPRLREHLRETTSAVAIKPAPSNPLEGRQPMYEQLLSCVARRTPARIRYASLAEDETINTKLSPYRLLFSRHSWYVIGRSSLHREVRTFNVGRIAQLDVLDERFDIPRRFSIDRYLGNAWHLIPERGADHEVAIRFKRLVARNVAEVVWHKTQRVVENADGSVDFLVTVSGLNEISWWILSYGDQAVVLRPAELRKIVEQRARNLLANYDGATSSAAPPSAPATRGRRGPTAGSRGDRAAHGLQRA